LSAGAYLSRPSACGDNVARWSALPLVERLL